eukprot:2670275-Pleurochrysis_carterae.AAC.1
MAVLEVGKCMRTFNHEICERMWGFVTKPHGLCDGLEQNRYCRPSVRTTEAKHNSCKAWQRKRSGPAEKEKGLVRGGGATCQTKRSDASEVG